MLLPISIAPDVRRPYLRRYFSILLGLILGWGILCTPLALAAPQVTEVKVSLGNSANELKFFPNNLQFVVSQRYKLILDNPSPQKHYFTAKDFADISWTQKVEAGKVEIKGAIHELELKPGGEAEWVFVPMKPGQYSLRCPIPGHTEAGMTGVITVSAQ
ncbi:MAG TPA: plastocyanin/azurin family copper-binding protein [Stenomitos sp.]